MPDESAKTPVKIGLIIGVALLLVGSLVVYIGEPVDGSPKPEVTLNSTAHANPGNENVVQFEDLSDKSQKTVLTALQDDGVVSHSQFDASNGFLEINQNYYEFTTEYKSTNSTINYGDILFIYFMQFTLLLIGFIILYVTIMILYEHCE